MPANTQYFRVEYGLDVNLDAVIGKELSVTNAASFGNNVTIQGDLTVNGVTTFNDSQTVELGSGQMVFVAGETGSPTTDARLTVNRGTSSNVEIKWNETLDVWQFTNNGTNYYPLKTYSDIVYQFSTLNSTNVDPGAGKVRFNNGTPSLVTQISIDNSELGGTDVSAFIDSFDDSNSSTKGFLIFRSSVNQDRLIVYQLTTITTQSGYRQFDVTHISGSTLFSNDDVLFLSFLRSGDKGDKGDTGQKGERISSGSFDSFTNSLLFTNSDGSTFTVAGVKGDTGPQGEKGEKGDFVKGEKGDGGGPGGPGPAVSSAAYNDTTNTITFTNADSSTFNVSGVKGKKGEVGEKGEQGAASTVAGPQGVRGNQGPYVQSAVYTDALNRITFTNSDSSTFTVTGVKGQKGEVGAQGVGNQGAQGAQGAKGEPSTVTGPQGAPGSPGTVISVSTDMLCRSLSVGTDYGAQYGQIRAAGEIWAFYSDLRLKKNIEQIKNATNKLITLTGIYYTQNELAEKFGYKDYRRQVGLIAQEVQKICPEVIGSAPFDIDENGNSASGEHFLTIQYEKLIPLLIEAIKEIDYRIKKLESK